MSYSYKQVFNATINALPKSARKAYKLANIAAKDRQQVGTPSYRILNQYTVAVSPVVGHPWSTNP
jgi:hypothetical protein